MAIYGQDTFSRANTANGTWGTATGGQTWAHPVGSATNFAVTSNEGVINSTPDSWDRMILGTNNISGTLDVLVRIINPDQLSCFGVVLRSDSTAQHNYLVVYDAFQSPPGLMLYYDNNNSYANIGSPSAFSVTNGQAYWIRGQITSGGVLRGKIWQDGTSEPVSWKVSQTDTTRTSGGFGVICNANTPVKFDHFTASDGSATTTLTDSLTDANIITESRSVVMRTAATDSNVVTESSYVANVTSLSQSETSIVTETHTEQFVSNHVISDKAITTETQKQAILTGQTDKNVGMDTILTIIRTGASEITAITESLTMSLLPIESSGDPSAQMLYADAQVQYQRIRLSAANANIQAIGLVYYYPASVTDQYSVPTSLAVILKGEQWSQRRMLRTVNDVEAFISDNS